jgi:hypothetical protein
MKERAHSYAEGGDQPRAAAVADAAAGDVEDGGAGNGKQDKSGTDKKQKRGVIGDHG